ncbi:MAG TPA: neutral zinc metallopeptidase [Bacteroidales bacterium]|nr:neutral zinc metallopeptidase [Bacteroidales bacterium]
MRWQGRRQSTNVEDRRGGVSGGKIALGGGLGTIIIVIIVLLLGGNPSGLLDNLQTGTATEGDYQPTAHEEELAQFVAVVLAETENVWDSIFRAGGMVYRQPKLVLFSSAVQSACGFSSAATGPFYCPADEKVYIDLNFLEEMQARLNAPGDFAIAYIISHEVGHHVQKQLGILEQVQAYQGQVGQTEYNQLTVRLELQADFLAGVWAHHAQRMANIIEEGDLDEAFNAASSVGDDRIQKQTQGYIVPDSFTHGTSAQRVNWFTRGWRTGDINQGDTFNSQNI